MNTSCPPAAASSVTSGEAIRAANPARARGEIRRQRQAPSATSVATIQSRASVNQWRPTSARGSPAMVRAGRYGKYEYVLRGLAGRHVGRVEVRGAVPEQPAGGRFDPVDLGLRDVVPAPGPPDHQHYERHQAARHDAHEPPPAPGRRHQGGDRGRATYPPSAMRPHQWWAGSVDDSVRAAVAMPIAHTAGATQRGRRSSSGATAQHRRRGAVA